MAKTKISEFSSTPANNTDIDSINIAEGCAPSNINDAIRELMAQLKDFQTGAVGDSFNGPIGSSTASTGAFTNITASGTLGVTGVATLGAGAILNTPASVTLTNATGLPISTGVSGLGTGVATALAVNVGSAGAPVVNGGALGTPSSGTVTNLTGTASININGTVGATTPTTGAFTTLAASSSVTLSGGTANGVTYLNGSKVLTSGSALTFDGAEFGFTRASAPFFRSTESGTGIVSYFGSYSVGLYLGTTSNHPIQFIVNSSEQMRLTSTGLGIGTSSPSQKLTVLVADAAQSTSFQAATGRVRFRPYADATNGAVIDSTNTAEGAYLPLTLTGSTLRLFGGGGTGAVVDSSGNLGLGVTPSAWGSIERALQVGNSLSLIRGSSSEAVLAYNAYLNSSGNYIYNITANSSRYEQLAGQHRWYTAASGTAGNPISFTQAMTLDASGNLLVGASASDLSSRLMCIGSSGLAVQYTGNTGTYLQVIPNAANGSVDIKADARSGAYPPMTFWTSSTERARIDSSGNLLVGTTSATFLADSGGFLVYPTTTGETNFVVKHDTGTASGATYASFTYATSSIGNITQNGTTAVAYNTTSDYRLKNTVAPMTGALAKVALLKPCTYKWNADGSDGEGFIAHELAEVVPQCVSGEKDAVDADGNPKYQGIDTSFLVATLTAAIQEQQAIIESLKARLDSANL